MLLTERCKPWFWSFPDEFLVQMNNRMGWDSRLAQPHC